MSVWHCLPCLKERERDREREMNGIVIHSKVNENPGSLLVCQHEEDTEARRLLKSVLRMQLKAIVCSSKSSGRDRGYNCSGERSPHRRSRSRSVSLLGCPRGVITPLSVSPASAAVDSTKNGSAAADQSVAPTSPELDGRCAMDPTPR